jgi:2-succinyl-6-hydroxy-2,4-cyclohexadiene-1-carboxylate synthase
VRVVLVPGFMQRGDSWRGVAELLPERFEAVLLDHSAHDLEGRLGEIAGAGEGAALAGYSLGGRLALNAAVRDPSRYRALITVGASAGIEDPAARAERLEADTRLAGWMEGRQIEDIVSVWERQPLFADQSDVLVEEQRAGRLACDPLDLASLLRTAGQGAMEPVWAELGGLSMPVLAVAGGHDQRYIAAARRIADSVPRGRAATVEHAGHAAHLQRPEAVAALIVDFLDEHFG